MKPNDLLKIFDSKSDIARAAGVNRQVVHGWFLRDTVPLEQQIKLEVATRGALLADISAEFRKLARRSGAPRIAA